MGTTFTYQGRFTDSGGLANEYDFQFKLCDDETGDYTILEPRQQLTPTPHALALPGLRTQQNEISPNVIGGFSGNSVAPGAVGATIGGGGDQGEARSDPNIAWDNFCTVSGGNGNEAGSNDGNPLSDMYATVGGGDQNKATAWESTIAGGLDNEVGWTGGCQDVEHKCATVGGGCDNMARSGWCTVAGGLNNKAGVEGPT